MSMRGVTHSLLMNKGGCVFPQNVDVADEQSMMLGDTRNIIFVDGGRQKRRGTTHSKTTGDSGLIQGLIPFQKLNGTHYVLAVTDLGNVYDLVAGGAALGTFTAASNPVSGIVFGDAAYMTSSEAVPKKWNGSTLAAMANIPTDWGTKGPKQFLVRRAGNANRIVAIGVPGKENTVYWGQANTDNMSDANVITMDIEVGETGGLVGGIEFGDRLIVFSRSSAFIIDDSSSTTANWTWRKAQWTGGAERWRLLCKTQNDLYAMMFDGDIYSVAAAQEYGDYKAASVARPAWVDRWIRDSIDLTRLAEAHSVYDSELRCVYWFLPRTGSSYVDMSLVYFIDRQPEEAWMLHNNLAADSGFRAKCSTFGKVPGATLYKVLTGGPVGKMWYLNSSASVLSDNSTAYESQFSTVHLHQGNPRSRKRYKHGHILSVVEGDFDLSVDLYVDGEYKTTKSVNLGTSAGVYGSGLYGTATYGGDDYLIADFPIGYIGTRLQYRVRNNNAGEDFFCSRIMTDFKELGLRPLSTIANR